MIGFVPQQGIVPDDWRLTIENPFAVVLITSLAKEADLANSNEVFITTMARVRNTGMIYTNSGATLIEKGHAPLVLESVMETRKHPTLQASRFQALDHDGLSGQACIPVKNDAAYLKGAQYQTMDYLIKREWS